MFTVYILYSEQADRYYTGFTRNFRTRLKKHTSGQNRSTAFAQDWKPVWKKEVAESSEARGLEIRIKKRGAKRFLQEPDF